MAGLSAAEGRVKCTWTTARQAGGEVRFAWIRLRLWSWLHVMHCRYNPHGEL